jgi:hypothetical protein
MNQNPAKYRVPSRDVPLDDSWDVIVIGGGPAGCAAAIASAREGAKTLLIEAFGALGGMGTLGLVPWFCGYDDGEKYIARGIAEKVRVELQNNMPAYLPGMIAIDPELLKRIYDRIVINAGASVLFNCRFCGVEMLTDGIIDAIMVADKTGIRAFRAKVYVDCTGDGDLAAWAGAEFEKGDEKGSLQPATMCFNLANVEPYDCWYNKERPDGAPPSLHFFDPDSPVHKAVESDEFPFIIDQHSCSTQIGPKEYGFNFGHIFDVDNTNPASVSAALIRGREQVEQYRKVFSRYHPAFKEAHITATGAMLGVRETRRITGDYILTIDDYLARESFSDEIARNAYNVDVHGKSDIKLIDGIENDIEAIERKYHNAVKQLGKGESYGIPYRCLTPHGLRNLLTAGRCISTDRQVNGSVRIMACCLTTGEAAGLAAAITSLSDNHDVHVVNTADLRNRLINYGAYINQV